MAALLCPAMTDPVPTAPHPAADQAGAPQRGSPLEVLWAFLRLGLSSFGGPVAHIGYFEAEFVRRRRWLGAAAYADLVALCQFLPGPSSSQVGMALGLQRAGLAGGLCAWVGFTLPSALLLIAFAYGIAGHAALAASGAVHGLKVVAVAIVAQAVWSMARTLCPDRPRAALAILAALLTLALPSALGQVGAIAAAGLLGWRGLALPPSPAAPPAGGSASRVSRTIGIAALALFALLLFGLPLVAQATGSPLWALVDGFFRAGALVFGGGHVVLPLLQAVVVPSGAVGQAEFLAGYGLAQAMPGPLFSFAAYLGAVAQGWSGGLLLLAAVFAPGLLLVLGALPFWERWRQLPALRAALAGINAGVVGLLLSALYDPVWTSAIHNRADFGLALAAFGLLVYGRVSPVAVVALGAAAGWALG